MPGGVSRNDQAIVYHGLLPLNTPVCGDGVRAPHREPCDDGNLAIRDGCSDHCEIEPPIPSDRRRKDREYGEPLWACPAYELRIAEDGSLAAGVIDFSRSYRQ